jgi:hypothetical protein
LFLPFHPEREMLRGKAVGQSAECDRRNADKSREAAGKTPQAFEPQVEADVGHSPVGLEKAFFGFLHPERGEKTARRKARRPPKTPEKMPGGKTGLPGEIIQGRRSVEAATHGFDRADRPGFEDRLWRGERPDCLFGPSFL